MKTPKPGKQLTFDGFPKTPSQETQSAAKQIAITEMTSKTGIDELTLTVAFKLNPSKAYFSKVQADLRFSGELVNSVPLRVPQGALATDECEYKVVLDMTGVAAGNYELKTELYEQMRPNEKIHLAAKEVTVDYVPQTKMSRLVKIPTVKTVVGADLAVASRAERDVYLEIEKTIKKEYTSKRDEW